MPLSISGFFYAMKIPSQLGQFKRINTLVIVAGKQDAALYRLRGKDIEKIDSFKTPKPSFTDREGRFGARGKGKVFGAGSVRELRDDDIVQHFLQDFKMHIKKISFKVGEVIIMAPSQTKNKIKALLPVPWQEHVRAVIEGNYFSLHPVAVVEKINTIYT